MFNKCCPNLLAYILIWHSFNFCTLPQREFSWCGLQLVLSHLEEYKMWVWFVDFKNQYELLCCPKLGYTKVFKWRNSIFFTWQLKSERLKRAACWKEYVYCSVWAWCQTVREWLQIPAFRFMWRKWQPELKIVLQTQSAVASLYLIKLHWYIMNCTIIAVLLNFFDSQTK